MLEAYYEMYDKISKNKQRYIKNKLIIPMLYTQYYICINYHKSSKPFREFDNRLKKYPEFYNHSWLNTSIDEFIDSLDNYLRWYSTTRIKLTLGGISPIEYRRSLGHIA